MKLVGRLSACARVAVLGSSLLTACGTGQPSGRDDSSDLGQKFGACSDGPGEVFQPVDQFLSEVSSWIQVTSVDSATKQPQGERWTFPAAITDNRGESHRVSIHESYWDGVDWVLKNNGTVWFALARAPFDKGTVSYVAVVAPDGSVFFPGDCNDKLIREPAVALYGDQYDAILRKALGATGDRLRSALHISEGSPSYSAENPVVLNPEDAPAELLDSLQGLVIHFRLSRPLGSEYTICTKVAAGWNDCLVPDESSLGGIVLNGYATRDGRVEVWLLADRADLTNPLTLMGTVVIPPKLRDSTDVGIDIAVDAGPGDPISQSKVTLVDAVPGEALDNVDRPGLQPDQTGSSQFLSYSRRTGRTLRHPTRKPIPLLTELVESSSRVGETILDPFAGVASTGVTAILAGGNAVLIEADPQWLPVAIDRLRRAEELRLQMKGI